VNDSFNPPNDTYFSPIRETFSVGETSYFGRSLPAVYKEGIYQLLIILVLLVFFSFDMDSPERFSFTDLFVPSKLAFFCNYLAAAMIINYVFLPSLYYNKRFFLFVAAVSVLITLVVLVDEYILEKIYFPDTRGEYFPGLIFTIVETLPIIIIMVAFKLAWDSNKKQREVDYLKNLMRESEIQFLKSQINPHFLFNNLNNLYAHAIDSSPKTPTIILNMANVLRYMLYDCREDFVPLSKEIQHLENYTGLHQLQIENRGSIHFNKEVKNENFCIPPLILMVFVENAFKHSTSSQSGNVEIDIELLVSDEGILAFYCFNNYSPNYQATETAKGIGLKNVRQRLDLLFPKRYQLDIDDDGCTYQVKLSLPLKPTT
jgi:sensor histidine kinase YesM